ncbi:MAG: glycerophosphoryl diester phosphodiesterase membrane domain-containing protein [Pseudomonadota bacterium]
MDFNMNTTWSRGTALVAENFQLLAIIAAVFVLIPSLMVYMAIPDFASFIDPNADPDVMFAQMSENAGPLAFWGILSMVLQFAGYAAMIALVGSSRPTVGEAIKSGFKAVPSVIGALLLFIVAYFIAAFVVMLPVGLLAAAVGSPVIAFVGPILILAAIIFLMARLSMTMPAIVLEQTANPVTAMMRSWRITAPHQWGVLGFWAVLFIAYFVISILVAGVFGVIAALASGATGSALILGLFNGILAMAIGMLVCGLTVAMFGQLAGPSTDEVSETFE